MDEQWVNKVVNPFSKDRNNQRRCQMVAVIQLKWSGAGQHKSSEGLTIDKNGKTVHNDYWLHKEFLENEEEEDSRIDESLIIESPTSPNGK